MRATRWRWFEISCICSALSGWAGCGDDAGNSSGVEAVAPAAGSAGTSVSAGATANGSAAAGGGAGRGPSPAGSAGVAARAGAGAAGRSGAGMGAAAVSGAGMGGAGAVAVGPPGTWPAADPSKTGPFMTVTENNVGPEMAFTMFRPKDLTQRHPVITWGNGTGAMPSSYRGLLTLYASHGFIVIASNSPNVAQGTPPPMLNGVTWVLEQDMTQGTALFGHVDREHIGATGHSQGAFAASSAGTDPRIKTIAPIETLGASRGLHGPVLGLCGAMDEVVKCSGNLRSFNAISDQPAMYAELLGVDHGSWLRGGGFHLITTAWFRVHLMNDTALRPMFYGECSLCKDTATWTTMRKMMDQ